MNNNPTLNIFTVLQNLEGKASIELQHKRVDFSSVSQPQILYQLSKEKKLSYFWTKCKFWPFAIHIKQYFNNKHATKRCKNT